ncbi:MAG TPA: DoxX family protein [Cellulomonadaceae bacterium]|nr:DoxX family protein [Cellulomonadaceae bacterium]
MDSGLLLFRLLIGLLLVGHGSQKLFGSFGGGGIAGTGAFFEKVGFRPGRPMALVAGLTEAGPGLFLALGLLTRLSAAAVIGTLLVAGWTFAAKGLWAQKGGYELCLLYGGAGAVLALTGPGAYSLDAALGIGGSSWLGVGAIALGLASGAVVIARATRTKKADALRAGV